VSVAGAPAGGAGGRDGARNDALGASAVGAEVIRFLRSSVNLQIGLAARMLQEDPSLARSGFPAAVVLGDVGRVRAHLRRDPAAATRVDPESGWSALHLACASRFHLDPERAKGLAEVTRLLLDAGAQVDGPSRGRRCWRPLGCAVTSANSSPNNEPIIRLLLERGAPVRAETLLASLHAAGGSWCLKLLLEHAPRDARLFADALAEALCEENHEAIAMLLSAGGDPDVPGDGGVSGRRQALRAAVAGTEELLGDAADPVDRLLQVILAGDAESTRRQVAGDAGIIGRLASADRAVFVNAAQRGNSAAVSLMLELGFPVGCRREDGDGDGATALHAAAWAGAADTVALLLEHGADVEARDLRWRGQPLGWALVGSGEAPEMAPAPDWVRTVTLLLDARAPVDAIDLRPGEPKQPSPPVVGLLRSRGLV
jgi:hypothetical protein